MLRSFLRCEDGNYAAIFSIAIVPIMAGVAGIVDFVSTATGADKLQNSLDATGLAIATKYHSGMSDAEVAEFATGFFGANIRRTGVSFDGSDAGVTASAADLVVDFAAGAGEEGNDIDILVSAKLIHPGFIGDPWQAKRSSKVKFKPGQPACVLALNEHLSDSVKVQGSTNVRLNGCVVASNSDATDAVSRGGSAKLAAKCISTVGQTEGISSTNLDCGNPLEHQYPSLDPLTGVVPPSYTACQSVPGGKTKTLSPGTYCNKTITGDVTLDPGVYILRGGQVKLGGGGTLIGHGVTIFLMEDAEFSINANETVDLSPPTSGPYAGITVYQEKSDATALAINGTADSKLTGFIYAPGAHVFYAGNSTMTGSGDCIRIIGDTIEMTGNSDIASSCAAQLGGRDMSAGRLILLVK